MKKIVMLTAIMFVVSTMAIAGGYDAGKKKETPQKIDVQKALAPVSAGGVKADDGLSPVEEVREVIVTTTPMPRMERKVSVLLESDPSNSGIEVDGVYIGVTPIQVSIKEGVHHIKISKEGYLSWEKPVKAYNGLFVSASLVSESTIKRESTRSALAK